MSSVFVIEQSRNLNGLYDVSDSTWLIKQTDVPVEDPTLETSKGTSLITKYMNYSSYF